MALAMLVTPVNITSVKADQIYNIEKSRYAFCQRLNSLQRKIP